MIAGCLIRFFTPLVFYLGLQCPLSINYLRCLRRIWKEARPYYALNCASLGCPSLQLTAFNPQNVESLLAFGAQGFINHPRGMRFEDEDEQVLSKIYDWYGVDFGGDETELLQHLMLHAQPGMKRRLADSSGDIGYEYDWDLNSFPRKGS